MLFRLSLCNTHITYTACFSHISDQYDHFILVNETSYKIQKSGHLNFTLQRNQTLITNATLQKYPNEHF